MYKIVYPLLFLLRRQQISDKRTRYVDRSSSNRKICSVNCKRISDDHAQVVPKFGQRIEQIFNFSNFYISPTLLPLNGLNISCTIFTICGWMCFVN